jgi:hypothetical protein
MQCYGLQHEMGRLFDAHCHLQSQSNITINARLVSFLWGFSNHYQRILVLDLDEYIRFYVAKLQTRGNMKLQFESS